MSTGQGGMDAGTDGESTVQFVIEELENLLLTVIEELRERPMVAAALGAAVLGTLIGLMVAGRGRSQPKPSRAAAGVVESLAPLAFALGRSRLQGKAAAAADQAAKTARSTSKRRGGLGVGSSMDLVNLGLRLLQNPIVRGYIISMVGSRLRRARR